MKKTCYGCQKEKGEYSFAKKARGKLGRGTLCKVCKNMYDRVRRGKGRTGDVMPISKRTNRNVVKSTTGVKLDDYGVSRVRDEEFKLFNTLF